ncbi:carboxypeptidase-like regulatory domain-containing protein [Shewanella sp. Isolate11]|uniref:carboxypeptidase-like regulatory domain-containing protein n=1 Tax=Shewanella sp. Isolate11 TaxID=2908530 RepID=UPI001EFCF24D|nr:carboxypeptidase-like regulatory domain-containing protein [Shewanella sp. Isolate11]MCG9697710.1 carboxypeptidase-like regulatory domain-containing protein [Shewanella sp. Isolate11]
MKNNKNMIKGALSLAVLAGIYANSALAAGPLYLLKPGQPYKYDVSHPVPVYTDQGELCNPALPSWYGAGCLTNEQANEVSAKAVAEWSNVDTSNFQAEIKGSIATDITGSNAHTIIGADNGGGIHILYDADATIITEYLGAPSGVLGIASPEIADENGIITESWAVMSVLASPISYEADPEANAKESMDHTLGVFTHEFGHAINLSHSQTNGRKVMNNRDGAPGRCSTAFDSTAVDYPNGDTYEQWVINIGRIETMYPFINPGFSGDVQGTIDITDDKVALSNIYPAPHYKAEFGTISGKILLTDGSTEISGVNVIARNINNPYNDAVSAMSGDQTQGMIGPDGSFTINGLTPGEEYVVYVEQIVSGGYPTTPAVLPSIAEYFNGNGESGNAAQDDPCAYTPIIAEAGTVKDASITFNGIDRAPLFVTIPAPSVDTVSKNGKTLAGVASTGTSWIWDSKNGFRVNESSSVALSENGQKFVGTKEREVNSWDGGINKPGYWDEFTGWSFFDLPNDQGCGGIVVSTFDTDAMANKVVGLAYGDSCSNYNAVLLDNKQKNPSWQVLARPEKIFEGDPIADDCGGEWDSTWTTYTPYGYCNVRGARANAISGDGTTVVGHLDSDLSWIGAAWVNGEYQLMGTDTYNGWIGSANDVSQNGMAATGGQAGGEPLGEDISWDGSIHIQKDYTQAYIWSPTTGTKLLGNMPCPADAWLCDGGMPAEGVAISDDGTTVVGRAGTFFTGIIPFIWRESIGMRDLNEFLQHQGVMTSLDTDFYPADISGSGKIIVGQGVSATSYGGAMVKLDQVWVCHNGKSKLTGFPGGMDSHLAQGAEVGLCQADRPIVPQ